MMQSLQQFACYEAYQDSGVEWLGEIPQGWALVPLKWYSNCKSGENIKNDVLTAERDKNYSVGAYGGNGIMGYTKNFNTSAPIIIIGRVGALCGNVHLLNEDSWISDNALILKIDRRFHLNFISSVLKSRNLNSLASKTAQPLLTATQVGNEKLPLPPLSEQTAIANFLDQKTAEIDQAIALKTDLIERLKEYKQITIQHAVTRGLNPNAKMKASGVEWIGDIPEGWQFQKAKFLFTEIDDRSQTGQEELLSVSHTTGVT
ncbi:MAG: restriction endonuclease subunit S, partial [Moraxellaceae bacterium]